MTQNFSHGGKGKKRIIAVGTHKPVKLKICSLALSDYRDTETVFVNFFLSIVKRNYELSSLANTRQLLELVITITNLK